MQKTVLMLLGLLALGEGMAQNRGDYRKAPTLAIQLGAQDFKTASVIRSSSSVAAVLGRKEWAKLNDMDLALGLSYLQGLSNHIDFSSSLFLSSTAYPFRVGRPLASSEMLFEGDASVHVKLLTDNYFLVPYLSGGIGASAIKSKFDAFMPLGGGLQFRLAPGTFAFSNFQYRVPVTSRAAHHFFYSVGFGTAVGALKTKQVEEPKPVPVAPVVTPPADRDGDGIPDSEDKCPDVKGLAKYGGCPIPDTDGDGINDEEDKCPTVKGIAKYGGCPIPDSDGDGINDEEDKCPNVRGLAKYGGCPPPDRDNDGVPDEEDRCPDVPGVASNAGCPEITFNPANILFQTGSATLTPAGRAELDKAAAYLKQNNTFNFTVEGHTDNTGSAAANKSLSQRRADAVKAYLAKKGVDASRITAVGYGQEQPVADNATPAGRAKNRRVEFKID